MKLNGSESKENSGEVTGIKFIMGSQRPIASNGNPPAYDAVHGKVNYGLDMVEIEANMDSVDNSTSLNDSQDEEGIALQYTRHERVAMKNFAHENRGSADVESFIEQAQLMLDMNESNLETILDKMLRKLFEEDEPQTSVDEAKRQIFTHDSAHQLCKTIQGTCPTLNGVDYDQAWLTILCTLPTLNKRHVAIARLKHPANLGRTSQEVYFIILVAAPTKQKGTKNALETGRTFSTLFSNVDLRYQLQSVHSKEEFNKLLWEYTEKLALEQSEPKKKASLVSNPHIAEMPEEDTSRCFFGRGLVNDLQRRLPHYISDFKDGFVGPKTIQKMLSTTLFLYFACLLPSIALGVLNDNNTHHAIGVKEVIWSQTIGGMFFALVGGQPMVILLTTAPLALYTKVVYTISEDLEYEFMPMYAMVGMWNGFFLILYSLFGASKVMAWSTRSTEEIFALFISIAFTVDACKDIYHDFEMNYDSDACNGIVNTTRNGDDTNTNFSTGTTENPSLNASIGGEDPASCPQCLRENSVLFLLLTLGTVWLGLALFHFTKTPFLNAGKREILADYSLPVAVLIMSFFGSYVFRKVEMEPFNYQEGKVFELTKLSGIGLEQVFVTMGLGFCLSLLFFMDQNISAAMVASPENRLKKGTAYHWDLLVIAVLNVFLTLFGLPMVHGALPHSPLHVKAMADMEDRVDSGHVYQTIIHVRETRITPIFSHILIGLSMLMLPNPLQYIPRAVLDGLFLYLAVTALGGNQMFERIMLLFTEQSAYPPNHYIRSVPQRKVHTFTILQIVQLAVMCGIGFSPMPYLKMTFPVLILLLLPIRHKILPFIIDRKFLRAIDGH